MWVKRKEWDEKCDSNRKLLRDKKRVCMKN